MVEEAGTYVLVFDNSLSKLTPKRVTFYVDVKADDAEVDSKPDLTGWMLKKKKQKGIKRGNVLLFVFEKEYCGESLIVFS